MVEPSGAVAAAPGRGAGLVRLAELRALHLSLATIVWGIMVGLTAVAYSGQGPAPKSAPMEPNNMEPING